MHCLRKLRSFNVQQELLQMFYSSIVCSMMTFGLACWGGNVTKQDRNRLDKQKAGGVVGRKQDDIETMYGRLVTKKLTAIWNDDMHHSDRNLTEAAELELHALGQIVTDNHSYQLPSKHTANSQIGQTLKHT
jgi:hypothetical protein